MKQRLDFNSIIGNANVFTSDDSAVLPDPGQPTRIRVNLTQVIAFKNNPRKTRNPKYDEIKESIRSSGLDTPPDVTREKPGEPYMIRNGGNTRLEILNELYAETGDKRFFEFDCIFHPWTNDFDLFIRHVKENEMRGQMSFIERALAARKAKDEIEKNEGKSISIRELSRILTDKGWPIDQSNLGQLLYAEETLLPLIPNALWELKIGIDSAKKIRKILDFCESYWKQVATADDGDYRELLTRVCNRIDNDAFSIDRLEYELCGEIARAMGGGVSSVQSQIQALAEKIIEPAALTRPSTMADITNLPAQSFTHSIAKTKAAKEKTNKASVDTKPAPLSPAPEKAVTEDPFAHLPKFEFPLPRDFDFVNSLSVPELKSLAYQKVCECLVLCPETPQSQIEFVVEKPESVYGFEIQLTQLQTQQLDQNPKYLGLIIYIQSLCVDTKDCVQATKKLLRQSGSLSAEETVGCLINFMQFRLENLILLTINHEARYAWTLALTQLEYLMAALLTYNGFQG